MEKDESAKKIPSWCWHIGIYLIQLNTKMIDTPEMTLSQFHEWFKEKAELEDKSDIRPINPGAIVMLLYGLVVVPKEIWEKEFDRFKFKSKGHFKFESKQENNSNAYFIRKLRNSIAHANFSFNSKTQEFRFWNVAKGKKDFETVVHFHGIGDFLTEIGRFICNEVWNNQSIETNT